MARILCGHCHKPIDKIVTSCFERDGSDSEYKFHVYCADRLAVIDLPETWCGWEASEDERMEGIRCPRCGEFPFDAVAGVEASIQVTCLVVPGEGDTMELIDRAEWLFPFLQQPRRRARRTQMFMPTKEAKTMKSIYDVRLGLAHCANDDCDDCPYLRDCAAGTDTLEADALRYIEGLEKGIENMAMNLKHVYDTRDAAIQDLKGRCFACAHARPDAAFPHLNRCPFRTCAMAGDGARACEHWRWRGHEGDTSGTSGHQRGHEGDR